MFKPKKKDLDRPTTVGDLHDLVDGIAEIVITKDEFKAYTDKAFKTFATKEDVRHIVEASEARMSKKFDQVTQGNDQVVKKLDTVLTEQAAISGNLDQYRDEVKDHKQRIEQLEAQTAIT